MTVSAEAARAASPDFVRRLAQQFRVDSLRSSGSAGSGHPSSSLSAADLMAALLTWHLRYDWEEPDAPANDHLVFSKGHASPLLYAMFKAVGVITDDDLMNDYRRSGSPLQGHPTPAIPWVDVATGSLGQGLPDAVGIALAGKHLDRLDYQVWVLCGDSEMAEGSMWEALDKASHYELGNLTPIIDVNRLGQRGPTALGWDMEAYRRRVEAFGCAALVIDGHDVAAIDDALSQARGAARPTVVLARTLKGKGVPEMEDEEGWHGKALKPEVVERAVERLGGTQDLHVQSIRPVLRPSAIVPRPETPIGLPHYELGERVATRKAYGQALAALGARPEVVVLDAEVSNSTHSEEFQKAYPDRFFEMFISEQQMIAAAVGLSVRGYIPFASSFGAFLSRGYDFVRMAGVSEADIRLCGSHAGVEIGEDGPSQMALEDIAAMRAVYGSIVLYPSDAMSTASLVRTMADTPGIVYMRTTRGAYPTLYGPDDTFPVGGSKLLLSSEDDAVTLIGAGVTVYACLEAAARLAQDGIKSRVIDLYSVKPVDHDALLDAAAATRGRFVIVEDHYRQGGVGSAVMEALADTERPPRIAHLAVSGLPGSGTPVELMEEAGISAGHIVAAARRLVHGAAHH
jgi:transketolase